MKMKIYKNKMKAAGAAALILAAVLLLNACGSASATAKEAGEPAKSSPVQEQTKTESQEQTQTASREQKEASQGQTGASKDQEQTLVKEETGLKNDKYGAALTDEMYEKTGENALISPVSINVALAMALEGAEGRTKEEIEGFLGVKKENLDAYITEILKSVSGSEEAKTIISNAFWYLTGLDVKGDYIKTLQDRYAAEVSDLDFKDAENAAKIINSWCAEHTNGLIPEIVTADAVAAQSDIILNTVYFKSEWQKTFGDAYPDTFHGEGGDYETDFLYSTEPVYYENDKATAFAKAYKGKYDFVGILPKAEGEFKLSDLDLESLLASESKEYDVEIKMPKLSFESGGSITDILMNMGITTAFTPEADFSGIADNLMISDVIHKARIILDENGTEAAAATAIMNVASMAQTTVKPVRIVELDRPYAFLIIDRETGNVLFAGKVVEP